MIFSNNPADYNRVVCMACGAKVKVHHMKKHLESHNMTLDQYKEMYGTEWEYVKKVYHKCGICGVPMLFDLETLFNHLKKNHQIKVKEYIELYIGPIGTLTQKIKPESRPSIDSDGAPIEKREKRKPRPGPASTKRPANAPKLPAGPASAKRKMIALDSWMPSQAKTRELSGRTSDPDTFNQGPLTRIQEYHTDGCLISNDIADYTLAECQICEEQIPMTRMRTHTKSHHGITITEYKAKFGPELVPVEIVWHRCGVCDKLIVLDSDSVAVHLKAGGHPRITHKDYNDNYMVDTRTSKHSVTKKRGEEIKRSSAYKVDDELDDRKPRLKVKKSKSEEEEDDEWQERKPRAKKSRIENKSEKKSSGSLSITPVATKTKQKPKKEEEDDIWNVNMNYISVGSSAESDEEENISSRSPRSRNTVVKVDEFLTSPSKVTIHRNSESPAVVSEDDDHENNQVNGETSNGVKSFQLMSGEKKLDVIMLFDN